MSEEKRIMDIQFKSFSFNEGRKLREFLKDIQKEKIKIIKVRKGFNDSITILEIDIIE